MLGCPVYDQTVLQGAHFPTHHPTYLGPLSRDQKTVRARLEPYDMAISLGSDFLRMSVYSEVGMSKLKARIDEVDSGFGVSAEGEFNGVGEGVLKLINRLAPISELSC